MIHKGNSVEIIPTQPMHTPPTDPTMWSFSSWWVAASYVVLHLWMIPNVLSSFQCTDEEKELAESGRVPMLFSLFYRMVGRWVYTIKLSKLISWT
jgi:hypothetical protein